MLSIQKPEQQDNKKKSAIRVMLEIEMPDKATTAAAKPAPDPVKALPIEDKVREALECIDSDHDSNVEWIMIRKLYRDLRALKRPSEKALNIMKMIEPVLSKYGYTASVETERKGK